MSNEPSYKSIFGKQWLSLPSVLRQRYSNRPFSNDQVNLFGILDIKSSRWMKMLSPCLRLCGALVPYEGNNVPVTVNLTSHHNSELTTFHRTFKFNHNKKYVFQSTLEPGDNANVIEFMRFGFGYRMKYELQQNQVTLSHVNYLWRLFGRDIPLPIHWALGRASAFEKAISETEFEMALRINHRWFGEIYRYQGRFKIKESHHE